MEHINALENYQRYGYLDNTFIQDRSLSFDEGRGMYLSNPPSTALGPALITELTTISEAFVRLPNIWLTMISLCLFYVLGTHLFSRRAALLSMAFLAFCSIIVFYGRTVTTQSGNTLFVMALAAVYANWLRTQRRSMFFLCCGLAFLGLWYGHYMAFFLVILFAYSLWFGTRQERLQTFMICLVGLAGLGTWLLYTTGGLDPARIDGLLDRFTERASQSTSDAESGITLLNYVALLLARIAYGISPFLVGLAGYGAYRMYRAQHVPRERYLVTGLFLSWFVYTTVFTNAAYIHDSLQIYTLAPPIALWAGFGVDQLWGRFWLPANRVQRIAGAAVFGHFLLSVLVIVLFIRLIDPFLLPTAQEIQERTTPDSDIATNLVSKGPHLEYYARRLVTYDVPYQPEDLQKAFAENLDLYLFCTQDGADPPEHWPGELEVDYVEPCYFITPHGAS